jgi:cytochrome c553
MITLLRSLRRRWRLLLAVSLGLPTLAVVAILLISAQRLGADYSHVAATLPATLAGDATRGAYLARTRGCIECHGENLAGRVMVDDGPMLRLVASNLTGEASAPRDAARFDLALRHGIGRNGRPLLGMPSSAFAGMSDAETADLRAHIAARPAVANALPSSRLGPIGRALLVTGVIKQLEAEKIDHARRAPAQSPPRQVSVEYGAYLAQSCRGCHGPEFAGGLRHGPPDFPPSANLTPHADGRAAWTLDDFRRALREGKRPDGRALDARAMPIAATSALDDTELGALWVYLHQVEARASPRG